MASRFRLRAHEKGDALEEARLLMRPAIRDFALVFLPFTSEEEGRIRIETLSTACHLVAVSEENAIVGLLLLYRGETFRTHSASFGIAVHEDWHRCGVGSTLMTAMIDMAENWLGLTRLTLNVDVRNAPAISLYKKFDFAVEGTQRKAMFCAGEYTNVYLMARLSPKLL